MLRKNIRCISIQTCRIGIIGTASLIEHLALASLAEGGDAAFQERCITSAAELFEHAMNACNATGHQHSATVFALFCDELARLVAKVLHSHAYWPTLLGCVLLLQKLIVFFGMDMACTEESTGQGRMGSALLEHMRGLATDYLQGMLCDVTDGKIDAPTSLPVSACPSRHHYLKCLSGFCFLGLLLGSPHSISFQQAG